ncbi:MAG: TAXI family TRAP transporter solute-binding subunit [Immundisolibacter sp.]|uniref:TAXI family TRAP transporter solute-binding subunit n=1 Tax=Immundisolibacter sp. TaxID=1934948 RepID=UPI003EE080FD
MTQTKQPPGFPGRFTAFIPAGAYDFVASDVAATAVQIFLVARADASSELTYRLATALYRQFDYLRAVHPAFSQLQASMLADAGRTRLHPGAARFYREVDLLPQYGLC